MKRTLLLLCVTIALAALSGCARHHHHRSRSVPAPVVTHQKGPPPHAPAHGQRRKQHHSDDGVELIFDSKLGVYVVVDLPDHYYWNGHYLRIEGGRWSASVDLNGHWEPREAHSLPPGLRKKAEKSHGNAKSRSKKEKKNKHGPAKGKW